MTELQAVAFRPFSRILIRASFNSSLGGASLRSHFVRGDREWALEITADC